VLLPLLEALLFALFGISVSTARMVPLVSLLAATAFLQLLVNRRYGPLAALAAGLLFVTSPMIVRSSRTVMAEMPALAFVIAAVYFLLRFCETERRSSLISFAGALVLSVYARPMTVLVTPALVAMVLTTLPVKRLLRRDVLVTLSAIAVLLAPAIAVPLMLSKSNAAGVMLATHLESRIDLPTLLRSALEPQFAWPVLAVAGVAVLSSLVRRDSFAVVLTIWVAGVVPALFFFGGSLYEGPRYTLYWVPAICALAGSALAGWRTRLVPTAIAALLGVGLFVQINRSMDHADYAGGYEEAAQFVLASSPGATVMFSGDVDTGYFAFFTRKHDPARRLVVLRADKILTTSRMSRTNFEERIDRPEQIYDVLRQYGTRYVVIEDRPSQSRVLEWLRQELRSPRFVERRRIPLRVTDVRMRGTSLAVYEYLDASAPAADAMLSMRLPVVGQSLDVPLRELIERKLLR
jgi:4-amino-4-deoxy-L-arabinose transferase-like glycosyltransferase